MPSSRRDFIHHTAVVAAAASLGPLTHDAVAAEAPPAGLPPADAPPELPTAIKAFERRMLRARPVPIANVRVTGGPLKNAQDLTAKYLLELDPDRMMAYYRVRAGLKQKAEPYAGWDGGGRNLTGHIAGHHLSGVALMYRATGDVRFKNRADLLVRELKEVQEKHGDGYLSALENGREAWAQLSKGDIRSAAFDLNGLWSPWYTLHKTYAGLRDAYRHTGNATALAMEVKFAKWAEGVLAPLDDAQLAKMLNTEHGGMNEVLADLYADTGDRRWLTLSYKFEHKAFTDPLKRHQDNLSGKHGNCQIPKLIGSAQRYGYTADSADFAAASFFWDRVAQHHSYATGGHGLAEYFGAPDQLSARVDGRTCETCNCYNMVKLTRRLFSLNPDAHYADFHERTLFNHILASIDNEDGRTSYMVPVGRGVQQEYQDMQRSFTCCVGTGMESHALHGDGLYHESDDTIWVNLFVPSTAQFTTHTVKLTMETSFPDGDSAAISLSMPTAKAFTLAVRRPVWAGDGFAVKVNGTAIPQPALATLHDAGAGGRRGAPGNEAAPESSYVEIKRTWKNGDKIELTIPKTVRLEATPDNKQVAAIMWGPLVLAGDHGTRPEGRGRGSAPQIPMIVAADKPIESWVSATGSRAGDFKVSGVARHPSNPGASMDVPLTPFHRTHKRTYSVYFDVVTPADFSARSAAFSAERERIRRLEAATVAFVQPGDPQAEQTYNYRSDPADRRVDRAAGRSNRGGTGWFSFDVPVEATAETAVVVTYLTELGLPPAPGNFQVLVEGTVVGRYEPNADARGFYDVTYAVPAQVVQGKARLTVRFEAVGTGRIVPVFGIRTVRARDL